MATTLNGSSVPGISTSFVEVVSAPATGKHKHVTSLILSNVTAGSITTDAKIVRNGGSPVSNIVVGAPLPIGSALELIINKPIILNEGDVIHVKSNTVSSIDATVSTAEA